MILYFSLHYCCFHRSLGRRSDILCPRPDATGDQALVNDRCRLDFGVGLDLRGGVSVNDSGVPVSHAPRY
jgi:hypothetical protein